ncbi:hypothetical protein KI387_005749, partial [Taxus chinensis]
EALYLLVGADIILYRFIVWCFETMAAASVTVSSLAVTIRKSQVGVGMLSSHRTSNSHPQWRFGASVLPRKRARMRLICMASYEAGVGVMGNKLGMMTFFEPDGKYVPVTVIGFREGNIVTQIKTEAKDGYNAVQVGYRRVREKKLSKPELGHLNKVGAIPMRHLQEFRLPYASQLDAFEPNQILNFHELFKEGDLVDVTANSIGKGFQGGIKRHHFKRGPMSHGSKSHRQLGSIGAGTTPGRVYKGKKMPGRMGGNKNKIRKLRIVKIDTELRTVMIKGAVPGKPGNL